MRQQTTTIRCDMCDREVGRTLGPLGPLVVTVTEPQDMSRDLDFCNYDCAIEWFRQAKEKGAKFAGRAPTFAEVFQPRHRHPK